MLPSLVHCDARRPKQNRRYRISQALAKAWFYQSQSRPSSGNYGEVRFLRLERGVLWGPNGEAVTAIAIKRSVTETVEQMEVALNEYRMHRRIYRCIPPQAREYLTFPFEMRMPCYQKKLESRRIEMRPSPLSLPEELSDEEESLVTTCDSSEVFVVQSWGCGDITKTSTLRSTYDALPKDILFQVGYDIGRVLWHIHTCGYTHHDIAMRNILVCGNVSVQSVLLDFGLAKYSQSTKPSEQTLWEELENIIEAIEGTRIFYTIEPESTTPLSRYRHKSVFIDGVMRGYRL